MFHALKMPDDAGTISYIPDILSSHILKSCCGLGVILVNTRVKVMNVEKPRDEFSTSFNLSSKILRHTERICKCDVYMSVCV